MKGEVEDGFNKAKEAWEALEPGVPFSKRVNTEVDEAVTRPYNMLGCLSQSHYYGPIGHYRFDMHNTVAYVIERLGLLADKLR